MSLDLKQNDQSHVVAANREHVWHHLSQHKQYETVDPRVFVGGKGLKLWDANGREYLDALSGGVWTVNVGYGRESIANAVRDQPVKLDYYAGAAGNVPSALFAEKLIEKMPGLNRVIYSNSGSEANEKAYKMVRQIAARHHAERNGKSSIASAIPTARRSELSPPPTNRSAPSNMVPILTVSSWFPIA